MHGRHEHDHDLHDHHGPDHDHVGVVEGMAIRRRRAFDDGGWGRWGGMGPGFGPGRGRGRGRGRARKGDVRLAVLALLGERPMHGYEIIGELSERTGGMWKPSPGSVYPTLQLLEEEGLVVGEELEGKRRFTLTDEGRAKVAEQPDAAPWEEFSRGADPDVVELWNAFKQMAMAVKQISVAAAPEQQRKALTVLTEARKKLYGILAED
jgi:DNA-binding PadR family transcriptional regulator